MTFPAQLVAPVLTALAPAEVATAFEAPHPTPAKPSLLKGIISGAASLLTGNVLSLFAPAAGTFVLVAFLGFGAWWVISGWDSWKETLREEGRAQVRASVNAKTITALQQANTALAAKANDLSTRYAELDAARQLDVREKESLAVAVADAQNALQAASATACLRPDAIIDALNRVTKGGRP